MTITSSTDSHRAELARVLRDAVQAASGPARKRFPSRYSPFIWSQLTGQPVRPWCHDAQGINHAIRQIHDFYGWMAKNGASGSCAGALYRTRAFLDLSDKRDGSKGPGRNIHIEHAVPVAHLELLLAARRNSFATPGELHTFLMNHSLCVAFTHREETAMRRAKVPQSRNDAFDESGSQVHEFPLRRYGRLAALAAAEGADFRIVNVVTDQCVDIDAFTFADHVRALQDAARLVSAASSTPYSLDLFPRDDWAD